MDPKPLTPSTKVVPDPKPLSLSAQLPVAALGSYNHFYGSAGGYSVYYPDLNSYTWFEAARLNDPVRVHLGESLGGRFVDSDISFTYLSVAPLEVGDTHFIGAEITPNEPLRTFWITTKAEEAGLITYGGATLLSRLHSTVAPEVVENGPFTPQEALEKILTSWRDAGHDWLVWEPIPSIGIRVESGIYIPTINALALFQDKDLAIEQKTMRQWLEEFIAPFSDYYFRVTSAGKLQLVRLGEGYETGGVLSKDWGVSGNASDTFTSSATSLTINLTPRIYRYETLVLAPTPASITVLNDGVAVSNTFTGTGTDGNAYDLTVEATLDAAGNGTIAVTSFKLNGVEVTREAVGYRVDWTASPTDRVLKVLGNDDLTPEETLTTLTDEIVNICKVTSKGYDFVSTTDILEPACGIMNVQWWCGGGQQLLSPTPSTVCPTGRYNLGTGTTSWQERATRYVVLPEVWKVAANTLVGGTTIDVSTQVHWYFDRCGDTAPQGYYTSQTVTGTAQINNGDWQLVGNAYLDPSAWGDLNAYVYVQSVFDADGTFQGFRVKLGLRMGDLQSVWAFGVQLNADGTSFSERQENIVAVYGEATEDPGVGGSQQVYGRRIREIDMGWFPVSYDDALSIAQAVVTNNYNPKREYTLELMPPYTALKPDDIAAPVKFKDIEGVLWAWKYTEIHSAATSRSRMEITVRETSHVLSDVLDETAYGDAVYTVSKYLE